MKLSPLVHGDIAYIFGNSKFLKLTPESQPNWHEFLQNNISFRFKARRNKDIKFSAVKDNRGYWTAKRKINGALFQKRLGNSLALSRKSPDELYQVALRLAGYESPEEALTDGEKALMIIDTELAKLEPRKTSERVKLAWQVLNQVRQQLATTD